MDPGEELGIVGGVARARRMSSVAGRDLTVNAIVDRVDARGGATRLVVGSEGEGEHRLERAPETAHVAVGLTQKRAVLRDPLRHERMRELQENRPAPAREERHLAMEPPAHRIRPESGRSIHGDPPLGALWRLGGPGPAPVLARERIADDLHAERSRSAS